MLEVKVRERTQQLEAQNLMLEDTRLEIIRRLGRVGEYRDNETGMHVIRMSKGCKEIALAAGLGAEFAVDSTGPARCMMWEKSACPIRRC